LSRFEPSLIRGEPAPGGRPPRRLSGPATIRDAILLRLARLLGRDRRRDNDACKRIEPGENTDPCRNTSIAIREPVAVLLLQRASDHRHQARWFSATLNLLISLAAQPLVLVSVSLTAPDDELKRMRAPRDTAPAATARAISADAPTQAELFT